MLGAAVALSLTMSACKDTKTLQENESLKGQVAELQKENGQLGNNVETLTADRDALAKENQKLETELNARKRPAKKPVPARRKRRRR
jgi:outer membrane murein-binding lipoprotein Lpp